MNHNESRSPTRREEQRRCRRDGILNVAAASFLEHGYAGTTMSAIAARLGGSKGTLWSYFPSKELLFEAVIDRVTETFRAELSAILNPGDELHLALQRFCTQFLAKVTSPDAIALHRLVIGEVARFPELGRIFYERAPRQTQLLLSAFLEQAMQRGVLRRDDPLRAAQQLTGLCMASCYQQVLMGLVRRADAEALEGDVARAVETFLGGYAAIGQGAGRAR